MKIGILLLMVILALVVMAGLTMSGRAGTVTDTVSPTVTVSTTVSLAMEDVSNVEWDTPHGAGSSLSGTIQARIGANTTWTLTVQPTSGHTTTNNLTDGSHSIPSSCFTYTSAAGSPAPSGGSGISSAIPFDGANQTNVWTGGTTTADCGVAITYNLQIPANQAPGTYTATHTYTVTSG